MIQKFEMSMMGELKYFLGFQVKQLKRWISGHKKMAQGILSVMSLGPHVGVQCRCTCPPLSYKREGTRHKLGHTQEKLRLRLSALKLRHQSNTQWSRVLRSCGLNHSKSSRVHVLGDRLHRQAKRLSPFLILGFRAGALRHPAGEFPL
jgi:hypothetical protein